MFPQRRKFTVVGSRQAIGKGKSCAVGIDAPVTNGARTQRIPALHDGNAGLKQFRQPPAPMSSKQRSNAARPSANNDQICEIDAHCHLFWRRLSKRAAAG